MEQDGATHGSRYDASVAQTYDQTRGWGAAIPEFIVEACGLAASSRLLDLACGTGNLAAAIRSICPCPTTGVDASEDMLTLARRKLPEATFVCADVAALPFPDGRFDCEAGSFFLHHLSPAGGAACVREAYRVLGAGSLAIVTLSHAQIEKCSLGRFFPEVIEIDKGRFPPVPDVLEWYRRAGFEEIKESVVMDRPSVVNERLLHAAERRFVSTLAMIEPRALERGLDRIREAIRTGAASAAPLPAPRTILTGRKRARATTGRV